MESYSCLEALGTVASDKKVCASGKVENQEKFDSSTLDSRNSIDDDYIKARKKLSDAEFTSDIQTEAEEIEDGKRKKRPNRRYLESSDESEEEPPPKRKSPRKNQAKRPEPSRDATGSQGHYTSTPFSAEYIDATNKDIEDAAKDWLRYSCDRDGESRQKAEKGC
uniref:Uncharacterized protein n=1 Tax=Magallana gigas TaxID=29159 RepID=K1Q1A6_MAGGI